MSAWSPRWRDLTESLIDCEPDVLLIDPYFDEFLINMTASKLAMNLRPNMQVVVLTAVVDTAHVSALEEGRRYLCVGEGRVIQ